MRLRATNGQTIVEYLAVLLIIGVLFLALLNSGLGPWVTATVKAAVCTIDGGHCAPGGSRSPSALDPSAPHSGPPIAGGPGLEFLPFPQRPGSISVGGSRPLGKGGLNEDGTPKDSPVKATLKVTSERSECTLDAQGHPQLTLGVSADLRVEAGGQAGGEDTKVGGSIFAGGTVNYQIKTDPSTADKIARGGAQPNPRDPRSIPVNSSIVMSRDTYRGANGSIAYKAISAELGYKDGRSVSAGVKRIDADHVQITVGDSKLVENSLSLKVGTDDVNASLSLTRGMSNGKLRSVNLDIGTPEGWAAYQTFVETGRLPADVAPGTADPTTSEVLSFTSTDQIGGKLGPFEGKLGGSHLDGQVIEVTQPDGTKTDTVVDNRGSTQLVENYTRNPDGSISDESYTIRVQNPDSSEVDGYNQFAGANLDTHGRDLTFTYTPAQLKTMQNAALDQIISAQRAARNEPFSQYTPEQMRSYLHDHPEGDGLTPAGGPLDNITLIDMARGDAAQTAVALYNAGQGSSSALLDYMLRFSQATKFARHRLGLDPGHGTLAVGSVTNEATKNC